MSTQQDNKYFTQLKLSILTDEEFVSLRNLSLKIFPFFFFKELLEKRNF